MQLPARTDGPHCWLWRLLYREADAALPAASAPEDRTKAAGRLWEKVLAGSLSISRDRSRISDDSDPWLPDLVAAEARRHVALSTGIDPAGDAGTDVGRHERPPEQRAEAVGRFIWAQLGNGWARVADQEDAILFWDPEASLFVPFDLELSARYTRLFGGLARS